MNITEDIEAMCKMLKTNKVYYQTSPHIPKRDESGQENFSKMKVDNVLEVWLMHPDLLSQFEQIVQNSGKISRSSIWPNTSVHLNQDCPKSSFSIDGTS
ncbi:MAG: hypothetical protein HC875_17995 [Anaerolineales bacterium]|nr:hypothetical protein [Anaerolineales bacterium]